MQATEILLQYDASTASGARALVQAVEQRHYTPIEGSREDAWYDGPNEFTRICSEQGAQHVHQSRTDMVRPSTTIALLSL
jgi:hypothetical protein